MSNRCKKKIPSDGLERVLCTVLTCSSLKAMSLSAEYNLAILFPDLVKEWHLTRNKITPDMVPPYSSVKVWWICSKGHEWEAAITSRSQGAGCPYCAGRRPTPTYSLQALYPDVAAQWHPAKNGALMPDQVLPHSNNKAWWVCSQGHEWEARIDAVATRSGCPYCSGLRATPDRTLAALRPELAKQWHPTKNGALLSKDVSTFSAREVWWVCPKGHEWTAKIRDRGKHPRCPMCSSLQLGDPDLAQEWHPTKNGLVTPTDVALFSATKRWWFCKQGHEYEAAVYNRARGRGCPYCAGKMTTSLKIHNPLLAGEWHPTRNGSLTPEAIKPGSNRKVWWKCKEGHEWQAIVNMRNRGNGCPYCHRRGRKPADGLKHE
jgi:hypothetical protein